MSKQSQSKEQDGYIGNIWGWKWSWISLIIILIFIMIALCRYIVVQPEQLISPDFNEQLG